MSLMVEQIIMKLEMKIEINSMLYEKFPIHSRFTNRRSALNLKACDKEAKDHDDNKFSPTTEPAVA